METVRRSTRPFRARCRRGWFATETLVGLAIVLLLIVVLANAVQRQQRASDRLSDSREMMRLAEQTITALQTFELPPTAAVGTNVTVTPLDVPAESEKLRWVRVTVSRGGRSVTLVGMARKS